MRTCTLMANEKLPIVFGCENSVFIIVDDYIVKKFFINDETQTLLESHTIIDWSALEAKP
jgi:hypothetical protein